MTPTPHPYRGAVIAFATMHGKEHLARGPFHTILGATVLGVAGIDTDQFGTFAGDIALEISRGRALEVAIARSIARWCRWTVNQPMAAQLGCAVGTTFLAAAILEANPERNAA